MAKIRHILWVFVKHLYTLFILLASDPFDIGERWFKVSYTPPSWLFWVLLFLAVSVAAYLTTHELRYEVGILGIKRLPILLIKTTKYLEKITKSKINLVKGFETNEQIQELGIVLRKCISVYGQKKELPKPRKTPITKKYRDSIRKKIDPDILKQLEDETRSWELNQLVGGILDNEGYGLQIDTDKGYLKKVNKINDLTKSYIGLNSTELNKIKTDYMTKVYATYSSILLAGYWEVLFKIAEKQGMGELAEPETLGYIALKYTLAEKYLSGELEKVKLVLNNIFITHAGGTPS